MANTNTELSPSANTQFCWLHEQNAEMMAKYDYGDECGKWMMFLHHGPALNDKWALARRLYNEGKLMGIHSMKVGTLFGSQNPLADPGIARLVKQTVGIVENAALDYNNPEVVEAYRQFGVDVQRAPIIFYCGPASNEKLMMEVGNNLLRHIPYQTHSGHIYYKTDAQTMAGTRATGQRINHTYKIPLH